MNDTLSNHWLQYLETPRTKSEPVKLDAILASKMRMFLEARKVKPYTSREADRK